MSSRHIILRLPRKGELASLALGLGVGVGVLAAAGAMEDRHAPPSLAPTICEKIPDTWGPAEGIDTTYVRSILGEHINPPEIEGGTTGYASCTSGGPPTPGARLILLGYPDQGTPCFQISPPYNNLSTGRTTIYAICLGRMTTRPPQVYY